MKADAADRSSPLGRILAGLDHPNVVKVFRCFEARNTAYLQMPWYRGEALHRLLQRGGTLNEEESLALAQPGGIIRLYVDLGPEMANLLQNYRIVESFCLPDQVLPYFYPRGT